MGAYVDCEKLEKNSRIWKMVIYSVKKQAIPYSWSIFSMCVLILVKETPKQIFFVYTDKLIKILFVKTKHPERQNNFEKEK